MPDICPIKAKAVDEIIAKLEMRDAFHPNVQLGGRVVVFETVDRAKPKK